MGFWTGMREAQLDRMKNRAVAEQTEIEEKRYQQGRTDRQEEIDLATMTNLRGAILPSILENYKLKRSDRAKTAQDILLATNAGFSPNAATYVVGSGKWSGLQEILKKHGIIGEAFIADTQQKLMAKFPDMTDAEVGTKLSEMMGILPDEATDGDYAAAAHAAVFGAATPDDLFKLATEYGEKAYSPFQAFPSLATNINVAKPVEAAALAAAAKITKDDVVEAFSDKALIDQQTDTIVWDEAFRRGGSDQFYGVIDANDIIANMRNTLARLSVDTGGNIGYASTAVQGTVRDMIIAKVPTVVIKDYLAKGFQTNYRGQILAAPWRGAINEDTTFRYGFTGVDYKLVPGPIQYTPEVR